MKLLLVATLALAVTGAAVAIADTHEDRETLMKANGGALKALSGAATTYDPAVVKAQTQVLIDNAGKIPALWAPGTEPDAGTMPVAFTDSAGFKAAADKLGTDAMAAQMTTDAASFAVALKTVQGDCGGCHKAYRTPPPPRPAAQ